MSSKDLFKPLLSLLFLLGFVAAPQAIAEEGSKPEAKSESKSETKSESKTEDKKAKSTKGEQKAISAELAPLLEKAYNQLKDGNNSQAVSTLKKAVKVDDQSITARRYYAFALVQNNQPANAIRQLNIIVAKLSKPTYFEWCTFGEAYLGAGGLKQAQNCYEQALKIAPKSSYVRSGLIRANALNGKYDEALKIAESGMKDSKTRENYDYFKLLYAKVRGQQMEKGGGAIPEPRTGDDSTVPVAKATDAQKAQARAQIEKNMSLLKKITSSQKKPTNHPGG